MTTIKKQPEVWIEAAEAAEIMTKNSGHTITTDYVRLLSNQKKIKSRAKNRRSKEYLKSDVEAYRVKGKGANRAAPQSEETPWEEKPALVA
jgi:hypothetical protein